MEEGGGGGGDQEAGADSAQVGDLGAAWEG